MEALEVYKRLPDKEMAWLNTSIMSIWRQRIKERLKDYPDELDTERPVMTIQATRDRLKDAEEALGWCDRFLDCADRKIIPFVLIQRLAGHKNVNWAFVLKRSEFKVSKDVLRKRYGAALSKIAMHLSLQIL